LLEAVEEDFIRQYPLHTQEVVLVEVVMEYQGLEQWLMELQILVVVVVVLKDLQLELEGLVLLLLDILFNKYSKTIS
jgi:hypothetical protein